MKSLKHLALVTLFTTTTLAAEETTLTVTISGVQSNSGKVMVAIFDSKETFTKKAIKGEALAIENKTATWTLKDLKTGSYAMAIYHDENGNGKIDKNFVGIPKEDYAFSRNAKGKIGPPKWKDASFAVKKGKNTQTITFK